MDPPVGRLVAVRDGGLKEPLGVAVDREPQLGLGRGWGRRTDGGAGFDGDQAVGTELLGWNRSILFFLSFWRVLGRGRVTYSITLGYL